MKSFQFLHRNTEYPKSILCSTAFVKNMQLFYKQVFYSLGRDQRSDV